MREGEETALTTGDPRLLPVRWALPSIRSAPTQRRLVGTVLAALAACALAAPSVPSSTPAKGAPAPLPADHGWQRVDLWATRPAVLRGRRDAFAAVLVGQAADLAPLPAPPNAPQAGAVLTAPRVRALRQRVATTLAWRLRLGRDPYLSFTPLADTPPCPARATVTVAAADGSPVEVWRADVPRTAWPAGPEVTLDLARWAGREVDLTVDVRRTAADRRACAMFWGSPQVLSRGAAPVQGRATRPNVLLIGADTLRADALGAWGRRPSVTPALDGLAAESDVWLDAFSTSNATNPSFASILTGLYVQHHGVRDLSTPLPAAAVTLAERLAGAGYDTAAVIAAQHLNPIRSGLGQGFATVATAEDTSAARLAVDRAIDWLQRPRQGPFFLWLHLFDPHTPHLPPAPFALGQRAAAAYGLGPVRGWLPFRSPGPPSFREKRLAADRDLYAGEVAYLDREVDRLLGFLRSRGLLRETVVAFVADHGENLEDHGLSYRHAGLWDTTTHVPLMIRWPDRGAGAGGARARAPGRRQRGLVQTIDLYPTLLAAAGLGSSIAAGPGTPDSRDLLAITSSGRGGRPAVYAEQADGKGASVRTLGWRYFLSIGSRLVAPGPYLYDLSRDPEEATNLAGKGRQEERELGAMLTQWLRSGKPAAPQSKLTPEEAAALRALGYQ